MIVCSRCKKEKDKTEFYSYKGKNKNGVRIGHRQPCKECYAPRMKERSRKAWEAVRGDRSEYGYHRWRNIKYRAKRKNQIFALNKEEFIMWFNDTTRICGYCGISEEHPIFQTLRKDNVGLEVDRMDNAKGYTIDNIIFACPRCNGVKGDFLSYREMKKLAEEYISPKWRIYA